MELPSVGETKTVGVGHVGDDGGGRVGDSEEAVSGNSRSGGLDKTSRCAVGKGGGGVAVSVSWGGIAVGESGGGVAVTVGGGGVGGDGSMSNADGVVAYSGVEFADTGEGGINLEENTKTEFKLFILKYT